MKLPSPRLTNLLLFITCSGLMLFAFFLEHIKDLEPCPLCISQRIVVILIGILALTAGIQGPAKTGTRIYSALISMTAIIGATLSARQIWLQNLPEDEIPVCGPGLSYIIDNFEYFPMQELITTMLSGTGDCAKIQWVFIGLSIPEWTLLCFLSISLLGVFQFSRAKSIFLPKAD